MILYIKIKKKAPVYYMVYSNLQAFLSPEKVTQN